MDDKDKINIGDEVTVHFGPHDTDDWNPLRGTVVYIPTMCDDVWILRCQHGVVYVKNYTYILRADK